MSGRVTNEAGDPLPGVTVKAFVDGFPGATFLSDPEGRYALRFPLSGLGVDGPDASTVVVWWIPTRERDLLPEIVLLRESPRARDLGLWSPCLPRIGVRPVMTHDVVLYPQATKLRLLAESKCLEERP